MSGRDVEPRARDRHGSGGPRDPGRIAQVRGARPAAHRPLRPLGRRRQPRPDLSQVPGRPARMRGRRQADARGGDRDDRRAAQPARRARPADRRDHRRGARRRAGQRRRSPRARHAHPHLRRAAADPARERARHARRALPLIGVLRAAPADRLGPRRRHDPRPSRSPAARGHQRRHDPRPRPVLGHASRRPARRRARRGDGLRGAPGPDVPARSDHLADRGGRPRPGDRHAGPRAARERSRSGRGMASGARASSARRSVRSRAGRSSRSPRRCSASTTSTAALPTTWSSSSPSRSRRRG